MDTKNIGKFIRRFLGRMGLNFFSFIIKFMSESSVHVLADFISKVGYYIAGRHRRIAIESLKIAFGKNKSQQEIEQIAKDSLRNIVKSAFEMLFFIEHPSLIGDKVTIQGKDYLDSAFSEGKGAIVVSAHFGNFPLMLVKLAQIGYKTNTIMRYMRDKKIENYFSKKRTELGIKTIYSTPRNRCVAKSLEVLKANEMVFIPMDQNFGTGGIFVDFFGMKAATATGPAVFALRTKAPIFPMFIVRNKKDNSLKIIIEAPLHIEESKDNKEVVQRTVQKITNIIEDYIRKYPEQWGWIHRRWKSRPKNEKRYIF